MKEKFPKERVKAICVEALHSDTDSYASYVAEKLGITADEVRSVIATIPAKSSIDKEYELLANYVNSK